MDIKGLLKGASEVVVGGLGGIADEALSLIKGQFREKMSEKEEAEIRLSLKELEYKRQIESLGRWNEQERQFQEYVQSMEGTAEELMKMRFLGPLVIFLRAIIRPGWSIITIYMIVAILSGHWNLMAAAGGNESIAQQYTSLLWANTLIVSVTWFGERAVRNVLPLVEKLFLAKNGNGGK